MICDTVKHRHKHFVLLQMRDNGNWNSTVHETESSLIFSTITITTISDLLAAMRLFQLGTIGAAMSNVAYVGSRPVGNSCNV